MYTYSINEDDDMVVTELAQPVAAGLGGIPEGKLPPRARRPLIGREGARRGSLGQSDWFGKRRDESHMPVVLYLKN